MTEMFQRKAVLYWFRICCKHWMKSKDNFSIFKTKVHSFLWLEPNILVSFLIKSMIYCMTYFVCVCDSVKQSQEETYQASDCFQISLPRNRFTEDAKTSFLFYQSSRTGDVAKGILEASTSQALETKCRVNVILLRAVASLKGASMTPVRSSPCPNYTILPSHPQQGPRRGQGQK